MSKQIEDVINTTLTGQAQQSALEFIAYVKAAGVFSIKQHDENDSSGWVIHDLCFMLITGADDFPGPWTIFMGATNLGENCGNVSEDVKEFAWKHVSPCGSCGGECAPGVSSIVFGKEFANTCQGNLLFNNPSLEAVEFIKKIIDVRSGRN